MGYQTYTYKDPLTGRDRYRTEWVDSETDNYYLVARTSSLVVVMPEKADAPQRLTNWIYREIAKALKEDYGIKARIRNGKLEAQLEDALRVVAAARKVSGRYIKESEGIEAYREELKEKAAANPKPYRPMAKTFQEMIERDEADAKARREATEARYRGW